MIILNVNCYLTVQHTIDNDHIMSALILLQVLYYHPRGLVAWERAYCQYNAMLSREEPAMTYSYHQRLDLRMAPQPVLFCSFSIKDHSSVASVAHTVTSAKTTLQVGYQPSQCPHSHGSPLHNNSIHS